MNYWIECHSYAGWFGYVDHPADLDEWLERAGVDHQVGEDTHRQRPFAFIRRVR